MVNSAENVLLAAKKTNNAAFASVLLASSDKNLHGIPFYDGEQILGLARNPDNLKTYVAALFDSEFGSLYTMFETAVIKSGLSVALFSVNDWSRQEINNIINQIRAEKKTSFINPPRKTKFKVERSGTEFIISQTDQDS